MNAAKRIKIFGSVSSVLGISLLCYGVNHVAEQYYASGMVGVIFLFVGLVVFIVGRFLE